MLLLRFRLGCVLQTGVDKETHVVRHAPRPPAGDRRRTVGIIVDGVDEAPRISQEQIAPPSVAGLGNRYLNRLIKLDNRLLTLLDIDKIPGQEEEALATAVPGV